MEKNRINTRRFYDICVVTALMIVVFYVAEGQCQNKIKPKSNDFICFPENAATKVTLDQEGITFTRLVSGTDAGCEYHPEGEDIPLDTAHGRIELQPVRSINRGYYVVTITFRGKNNRWADKDWIPDINEQRSTKLRVLNNVLQFAKEKGITEMDRYFLKIRVQPHWFKNKDKPPSFVFSRISIGPVQ